MFIEKVPYIVTVFVAALAWTVTHFVDRVVETPAIEYKIENIHLKDNYYEFRVHITNLSNTITFRKPEFTISAGKNENIRFRTDESQTQVVATPPATAADTLSNVQGDAATFTLAVLPPKSQIELLIHYTGDGSPVFNGRPPKKGNESFMLIQSSFQTWLARNELLVISIGLLAWLAIMIYVAFANKRGAKCSITVSQ